MLASEFSSTDYAFEQIIRPNNIPSRVFYRTRRKAGFLKSLNRKINMKLFNTKILAVSALAVASASSAYAAVPAEVTTALSDAKTDGVTVAGLFLVAVIAIAAFGIMRRGVH